MFVQPEDTDTYVATASHSALQLANANELKVIAASQHSVQPYKTFKRGTPAIRSVVNITPHNTNEQRHKLVVHSLSRLDSDGNSIPADTQTIGAFSGFQARIRKRVVKSKAYYFLTFPKPPQKLYTK